MHTEGKTGERRASPTESLGGKYKAQMPGVKVTARVVRAGLNFDGYRCHPCMKSLVPHGYPAKAVGLSQAYRGTSKQDRLKGNEVRRKR
jgi:hypothetical protein